MIDRKARIQMIEAIRSFMDEKIGADEFDEALCQANDNTSDKTVQTIAREMWFFYDDLKDHKIVACKQTWDYFNRLLLLLESNGEVETAKSWYKWHPLPQGVAAFLFIWFIYIVYHQGFGEHLIGFAMPFGPPSMLLAWINARQRRKQTRLDEISLTPFPTFGSLLAIRRQVSGFKKRPYPKAITGRRIRDPISAMAMWMSFLMVWCMFAPIALFLQMLPERRWETRITMSAEPSGEEGLTPLAQP